MKTLRVLFAVLFVTVLAISLTSAQNTTSGPPCSDSAPPTDGSSGSSCAVDAIGIGNFHATPFTDACDANGNCSNYLGDPANNIQSLYGSYGNTESTGMALTHFTQGTGLAGQIVPRCQDGSTNNCSDSSKAIVALIIGFSNCDIEVCGGSVDAWDGQDTNPNNPNNHLQGQPCATSCANWHNPDTSLTAWNQVTNHGSDGKTQESFLYRVYSPSTPLVGPHVAMFNGALGRQSLDTWDPTATGPNPGYYATHDCPWDNSTDFHPECNYNRVRNALLHNGYDERQVQVVLVYSSDSYPTCDMKAAYCSDYTKADAYISETYLGRILRYLKCCKMDANGNSTGQMRYPHLQQVFVTSRTYGGYANGQPTTTQHCLMPEPYAYEESFGLQRTIVAQINRTTTDYAGDVRYPESAPWTDWGPYLWADGPNISPSTGLFYCDSSTNTGIYPQCLNNPGDVRFGDLMNGYTQFWGDHTHPTAWGTKKVADRLVTFFTQSTMNGGSPFVQAWKGQ